MKILSGRTNSAKNAKIANRPGVAQDDEEKYVALARDGDKGAFEFLVKKYETKVYGIASHMLPNAEDARDAAQEAFIKAYRSISRFRGESKFSTWLYRITNNVCLDQLRKRDFGARSLDSEIETADGESIAREIQADCDVAAIVEESEF
jgi:RNA polymerase sigma-70 factor (ECF subfamily)